MRHVYNVIRNVTCAQGYQKCDLKHVYKVIRNVMWHVYKVVRNVADVCTELS